MATQRQRNRSNEGVDQKLANYLIHDIDIKAIIDVVKKHHNEPNLISKLNELDKQYNDLSMSPYDTAQVMLHDAPQFEVFHILRQELAGSEDTMQAIIEELYSDESMSKLIENFEEREGISLIGAIEENKELKDRYTIRVGTFRKQLYNYLVGEHKTKSATMNYLMSTKKTLAELLVADHNNRA